MKKYLVFCLFIFLCIFPFKVYGEELSQRVILIFNEEIDYPLLDDPSIEIHHIFEDLHAVSATIPAIKKQELSKSPSIKCIEEDPVVEVNSQTPNWGYQTINSQLPKSDRLTGQGVKIGIIDTGINLNHPDLKVSGGKSFVAGVSSYTDDFGHGTHVAGIIAAQDNGFGIVGIAPDAQIYAVKVLNNSGTGNQSDVVAGINWAVEQQMDILNLSITSPQGSYLLEEALQKAYDQGVLIVAASGNYLTSTLDRDGDVLFPARYPTVLAVGSVNRNLERSTFSYIGQDLEFVAPGEDILSTYIGTGTEEYSSLTGTSMATPFVAGVAALYKQEFPLFNNVEIRSLMQKSAKDLGERGKDIYYGHGLIQPPSISSIFPDVLGQKWYTDEIEYLYKNRIVKGYPDGNFRLLDSVTRAEAVTMLGRALKLSGEQSNTVFIDVPFEHYASGYVNNATNDNVIEGLPDGTFQPLSPITRGDVAVILQRAFEYPNVSDKYYSDVTEGNYYDEAINAMAAQNISNGYPDGTFKPDQNISRVEFSVLLSKAMQQRAN